MLAGVGIVSIIVGFALQSMVFGELLKEAGHRYLVAGFTGDSRYLLENLKYPFGNQIVLHFVKILIISI